MNNTPADPPRILPLDYDELDAETQERFGADPLNLFRTVARHPKLLKRWMVFGFHVLFKSSLPEREKELLILRTGWNCGAEYEFAHHVVTGREAGVTDEEIVAMTRPVDAYPWSEVDRTLLQAADELHADRRVADLTWTALTGTWSDRQLLDLLYTVGQYTMVSMVVNTIGVDLDHGLEGFPSRDEA